MKSSELRELAADASPEMKANIEAALDSPKPEEPKHKPGIRMRYKPCPYCIQGIDNCTHDLEEEPAPADDGTVDPETLKIGDWYQWSDTGSDDWSNPMRVTEEDSTLPWAVASTKYRRCAAPAPADQVCGWTPAVDNPSWWALGCRNTIWIPRYLPLPAQCEHCKRKVVVE